MSVIRRKRGPLGSAIALAVRPYWGLVINSPSRRSLHPSGNSICSAISEIGRFLGTEPRASPAKAASLPPHSIGLPSSIALWSAPAERSGDGALASPRAASPAGLLVLVVTRS